MVRCPNCDGEFSTGELKEGDCPYCGYTLGSMKPPMTGGKGSYEPGDDISGTFSAAFDIMKNNLGAFLPYLFIPAVIVAGLNIFLFTQTMGALGGMQGGDSTDFYNNLMQIYAVAIPISLISTIINVLFAGGVVGMVKEGFEGKEARMMAAFDVIKKHPLGIIGASIVLTILISLGMMLCLIPGLFFCYWWLFTIPILVIEGKSIGDAMSSSKRFAKARGTMGFSIVLVIVIVILQAIAGSVSVFGAFSYSPNPYAIGFTFGPMMVVLQIVQSYLLMLVSAFAISSITVHYLRGKGSVSQPPAPPTAVESRPPPPPPPKKTD